MNEAKKKKDPECRIWFLGGKWLLEQPFTIEIFHKQKLKVTK